MPLARGSSALPSVLLSKSSRTIIKDIVFLLYAPGNACVGMSFCCVSAVYMGAGAY